MITKNSNRSESHRFRLTLADKVNLKHPNKIWTLHEITIHLISAPSCNDEFDLVDGSFSVSDIQDYFEYIIKNMKL